MRSIESIPRDRSLEHLARLHGVQPSYLDVFGRRVGASRTALRAVLGALGVEIDRPSDIDRAIATRHDELARRVLEPVAVLRGSAGAVVALNGSLTSLEGSTWVTIRGEDGTVEHLRLGDVLAVERTGPVLRLVGLSLEPGYYRLRLEDRGVTGETLLVVAPAGLAPPERRLGLFAPLYGVRSSSDWGTGSYGDLAKLTSWAGELGASFVATLPLYAAFLDEPFEPSPYRPVSRLAWNELYLDVEQLPELQACPEARRLIASAAFREERERLNRSARVEYRGAIALKLRVLELLAAVAPNGPRQAGLKAYLASDPDIDAYARFRADHALASDDPEASTPRSVGYHRFVQFATDSQLAMFGGQDRRSSGALCLDFPVGVHPDGFDPVRFPSSFASGASIGAPPDLYSPLGQDWAVVPMHPDRIRDDGYRYLIACCRKLFRHASIARLDHVMGLTRLYFIPNGLDASAGAFVRYHQEELRAIAVLEAQRAGATVIGEDLGTVLASTRRAMTQDGMLRSIVYQFMASPEVPFPRSPVAAVASFGTHDLARFAGYLLGRDLEARVASGEITEEAALVELDRRSTIRAALEAAGDGVGVAAALEGFLGYLARLDAAYVVVDLGDLILDEEQENRPGTSGDDAWRHRVVSSLEELAEDGLARRRIALAACGRVPLAVAPR